MTALQEIHSFVTKFITLCNNGKSADLSMRCEKGHTIINLQLNLPEIEHDHQYQPSPCPRPSPSRVRRSTRRAFARAQAENVEMADTAEQVAAAASNSFNTAEKATLNDIIDKDEKMIDSKLLLHAATDLQKLPAEQAVPTTTDNDDIKQTIPLSKTVQEDTKKENNIEQNNDEKSHAQGDTVPGYKQFDLVCNFCDEGFGNKTILKEHTRIKHNSGRVRYRRVERT